MKKIILLLALSINAIPLLADDSAQGTNQESNLLPDSRERASYAMGMYYGHFLQQRGISGNVIDSDTLIRGLNDALSGGHTLLTPQEMSQALRDYQQVMAANQMKMQQQLAAKNLADDNRFFAVNGTAPGVVTLPGGLQYRIVTPGSGPLPSPTDMIRISYQLSLLNGASIQNTPSSGILMPLGSSSIIPGMREAFTNMPVGSVWDLWIPPSLAYGEHGRGPIPPNSALSFHVQLLSISTNTPPPAPPQAPLTSDIIAVPSAQDLKNGKKPYTLTPEQVQQLQSQAQTNGSN